MLNLVYDLTGCALADVTGEQIMTAMGQTASDLGCTVMSQLIQPFRPHGHTCVLVLAESHLTVSTWPETGHVCVDLFTCRALTSPDTALIPLLTTLGGKVTRRQVIDRAAPITAG